MTEGIGKALASAIKEEPLRASERTGGNLFSNQHRRDIFSLLTIAPCASIAELSSRSGISQNSVGWHLDALIRNGYVVKVKFGKCAAYYPDGLISGDEVPLFCTVNRPGHAGLLGLIIKRPGLSQSEIAEALGEGRQRVARMLAELIGAGVVNTVAEGAHVRHYPTRLLPERAEGAYQHSRDFSEYIVRRLAGEGGAPPAVVKRGLDRIVIEFGHASARFTMDVGINPYLTCIPC